MVKQSIRAPTCFRSVSCYMRWQPGFRYNTADVDFQEVGRELTIQAILTGRIMLRGDVLVINMELIDVEKDAQLWGQQYTKKMSDIIVASCHPVAKILALRIRSLQKFPKL